MSLLWIVVIGLVALMWVITFVDIFARHYPGKITAAWICLVVLLPVVGSIIYWFARKSTPADAEQQYLAEADLRRSAASRPFDGTGL